MGFFFANIPLTTFHQKRQRRTFSEQLLREGHSFKRARSVPTTPSDWRYFFLFSVDHLGVSFFVVVPLTKNVYTKRAAYRQPKKAVGYPCMFFTGNILRAIYIPMDFCFMNRTNEFSSLRMVPSPAKWTVLRRIAFFCFFHEDAF